MRLHHDHELLIVAGTASLVCDLQPEEVLRAIHWLCRSLRLPIILVVPPAFLQTVHADVALLITPLVEIGEDFPEAVQLELVGNRHGFCGTVNLAYHIHDDALGSIAPGEFDNGGQRFERKPHHLE
jgi:hypothetical protein